MRDAPRVFFLAIVAADSHLHDPKTQDARQIYVQVDKAFKYGFELRQPCGNLDWKPEIAWVMPSDCGADVHGP